MDYVKAALATVGVVQLFKLLFPFTSKVPTKVWCLLTILTGVGMTFIVTRLPPIVIDCIFVVSGSTLFYDTIYKSFEKLFTKGSSNETSAR